MTAELVTVSVAGLPITDCDTNTLVRHIARLAADATPRTVLVYGAHVTSLNELVHSASRFLKSYARADVSYADGFSVHYLARLAGAATSERIATTDLLPRLIKEMRETLGRPLRVGIVGGTAAVSAAAAVRIAAQDVRVVYATHGYHADWTSPLSDLRHSAPDLVLVGLGMPLEAYWCEMYEEHLPPAVHVTCGGLLRILAGVETRAPVFLQTLRLEWLYRMMRDPIRTASRYSRGLFSLLVTSVRIGRTRGRR